MSNKHAVYEKSQSNRWLKTQNNRQLKKLRCGPWKELCAEGKIALVGAIDESLLDEFTDKLLDKIEGLQMETSFGFGTGDKVIPIFLAGAGKTRRHSYPLTQEKLNELSQWLSARPEVESVTFHEPRDAWWGWN